MRSLNEIISDLKPQNKVFIIGAAIVDTIIKLDRLPTSGEDITAYYTSQSVGGCAFNVADVLSKLNLPFDLMVPVGTGSYSKIIQETMARRNYKATFINGSLDNGCCLSFVEKSGERTFITMPGLETAMKTDFFADYPVEEYDYIYISGYEVEGANGQVLLEILQRKKPSAKIIFDPGPRVNFINPDILKQLLFMNTILTINDKEALAMINTTDVAYAGRKLHMITNEPVVITLGKDGALIAADKTQIIPGFKIVVKDTIGAGDAHTGGILVGLLCNLNLDEAVYLANKIAAYVVSQEGAATAPTLDKLI